MNDVAQQFIPDCWILAPLAEIALQDPQMIKNMIKDNPDGTYTVTFKEKLPGGELGIDPHYDDHPVVVNSDMPADVPMPQPGALVMVTPHAAAGDPNLFHKGEIWPQIIEKAYAELKGGYAKIYHDGLATEFMEAMTGRQSTSYPTAQLIASLSLKFDQLQNYFNSRRSVVVCTAAKVSTAGLIGSHCYALRRIFTDPADGKQWIELYNPWGTQHIGLAYDSLWQDVASIIIG